MDKAKAIRKDFPHKKREETETDHLFPACFNSLTVILSSYLLLDNDALMIKKGCSSTLSQQETPRQPRHQTMP